jgi:hypothetical protein
MEKWFGVSEETRGPGAAEPKMQDTQ